MRNVRFTVFLLIGLVSIWCGSVTAHASGGHALIVGFDEASGFPSFLGMQKAHKNHGTSIRWYVDKKQISAVENHFEGKLHGPFEYFGFKGESTRRGYYRDNAESTTPVEHTIVPELEDLLRQYLRMGTPKGANWPELQANAPNTEAPATVTSEPASTAPTGTQTASAMPDLRPEHTTVPSENQVSMPVAASSASETISLTSMFDAVISGIAGPAGAALLDSEGTGRLEKPEVPAADSVKPPPDHPDTQSTPVEPDRGPVKKPNDTAVAFVICPSCKKNVEAGAFCDECGSSLASEKTCVKC